MRKRLWALGIALMLTVTGCTAQPEPEVTETVEVTPVPVFEKEESDQTVRSVLYYPSEDGSQLVRQVAEVEREEDTRLMKSVLDHLLEPVEAGTGIASLFRGRAQLKTFSQSRNLATVDISVNRNSLTENEILNSVMALVQTVTESEDIKYVSILINGELLQEGILVSPMERQSQTLEVLQLFQEAALSGREDVSVQLRQRMTAPLVIFFKDASGTYLLPEVQSTRSSAENAAAEVLYALQRGPANSAQLSAVLRSYSLTPAPSEETDENGRNFVRVNLAGNRSEVTDSTALRLLCGAITLSVMYNLPDVEYVQINLNGQPLTAISGMEYAENGNFTLEEFKEDIGDIGTLYFPNRAGSALVSVTRAMSQEEALRADIRVKMLLSGLRSTDTSGAVYAFPVTIGTEDLLGVVVEGDCAYVDLTENFRENCSDMTSSEEVMMVYSVVNTLTEMESINRVQFLVEGERVETLAGYLDVSEPLWRNPGIMDS